MNIRSSSRQLARTSISIQSYEQGVTIDG